jgi:adenylate cyclase
MPRGGELDEQPGNVDWGGVNADAFGAALATERVRTARLYNLFRFGGVSAFFALTLLMGVVLENPDWAHNDWTLFAAYWLASGMLLWLAARREAVARWSGHSIPLMDMPAVFFLQLAAITGPVNRGFIVGITAGIYVLLIIGAMATLHSPEVAASAAVAAALQVVLQRRIGMSGGSVAFTVLLMMMAAAGCTYVIQRVTRLVGDVSEEQGRRERLARYFSPEVAAMLAAAPDGGAAGESREVTLLFSDLRDFTALAERLDGRRVVAFLNAYHEAMVDTIFAFGGTLDKYLGDGLMAYFGAPVAQPDHAERAVRCALTMQERLGRLNAERPAGAESALRMGIGVHTGTVVLGDIGARRRREYTAIGDAVNVAARLEQLTKARGVAVLVSESTRAHVGAALGFAPVGVVEVRGRSQPLAVYRPACGTEELRL